MVIVVLQIFWNITYVATLNISRCGWLGDAGAYFHRCDAFSSSIEWKAGSESFAIVNVTGEPFVFDMLAGPPCSWTYVYASSSGRTLLQATLSKDYQLYDQSYSGPIILKASSRIAAYRPLILHQASDGNQFGGYWFDLAEAETNKELENLDELYLAPDTSLDVMLRGGPGRSGHGVDFFETVETLDDEDTLHKDGVINVNQISSSYVNSYRISCQKLGTFVSFFFYLAFVVLYSDILFYLFRTIMKSIFSFCFEPEISQRLVFKKRGNLVGDDHPLPAVAEVGLLLRCTLPSTIVLIADEPGTRTIPLSIWMQAHSFLLATSEIVDMFILLYFEGNSFVLIDYLLETVLFCE